MNTNEIKSRVKNIENHYKNVKVIYEDETDGVLADMESLISMNSKLIETINRYKNALEFYADEEHWGMIDGVSYLKGADQWIAKDALEGNTP